jgi:hypothetical protein
MKKKVEYKDGPIGKPKIVKDFLPPPDKLILKEMNVSRSNRFKLTINKEWHLSNRMPIKANLEVRGKWHLAHQKNCNCREIPQSILAYIGETRKK